MTWVRLDDQMLTHPKIARVGGIGLAVHVAGILYSGQHLTDGFVPRQVAPILLAWPDVPASEPGAIDTLSVIRIGVPGFESLEGVGLWEPTKGGWRIHDYLKYNPSKAEVLAMRAQRSEAGRKGGLAKADRQTDCSASLASAKQMLSKRSSKTVANAKQNRSKTLPRPPSPSPSPLTSLLQADVSSRVHGPMPAAGENHGLCRPDSNTDSLSESMDIPTETRARVRLVPNDAPGVGVDVASPRRTVTRDDERVVFLERHGVTGAVCLVERNPVTMARLSQVVEAGRERGLRGDDLRRWLAAGVMRADPMTTKRKAAGESGTEAT